VRERSRSISAVLLFGAAYALVGLAFGAFAHSSAMNLRGATWNRLAWLVSGVAFAAHIGYEHFRLRNSPRTTAMHASIAAALGAFGLAVAANVHGWLSGSGNSRLLVIALVAWPLLTAIPAFAAAMIVAAVLKRCVRDMI